MIKINDKKYSMCVFMDETIYEPYVYNGGVYKHDHLIELLEDLGGYLVNKIITMSEVTMDMFIPSEDIEIVNLLSSQILGKLIKSPLTGIEIAVVSPTLSSHHLPHAACDIAESLRHPGAKTTMIGLARGMGRSISLNENYERNLINEHDISVFSFGVFKDCIINKKIRLFEGIDIPIVVVGGPNNINLNEIDGCALYVGNIGRLGHRIRHTDELKALEILNTEVSNLCNKLRQNLSKDPPCIFPAKVMKYIQEQVPELSLSTAPVPISLKLSGLRVKLQYTSFKDKISNVEFDDGTKLSEVSSIIKSCMNNYILVNIKKKSDIGYEI